MDGVVSAGICAHAFGVTHVRFAGPNAIVRGDIVTREQDIVCDLPYPPVCGLWFDHHVGNMEDLLYRKVSADDIPGRFAPARSCSRVIYEYCADNAIGLPPYFEDTVEETDVIDSFDYQSVEEWRRETPGKLVDYSIKANSSNLRTTYQYMRRLVLWIRDFPLADIASLPEVRARVSQYKREEQKMLRLIDNDAAFLRYDLGHDIVILDLTKHKRRPNVIKNLAYLRFPDANAVLEVSNLYDRGAKTTHLAFSMSLGITVKNSTPGKDVGEIMRALNIGDGHRGAGAGVVYTKSKADMITTKETMLQRIYDLWIAQEDVTAT
jgi:hypothetical protein